MLSNAYFLAKFRFDTAENEPAKNLQIFEKCIFRKGEPAGPEQRAFPALRCALVLRLVGERAPRVLRVASSPRCFRRKYKLGSLLKKYDNKWSGAIFSICLPTKYFHQHFQHSSGSSNVFLKVRNTAITTSQIHSHQNPRNPAEFRKKSTAMFTHI